MSKRQRKPIPKALFKTTIESLSHDGRGIAHLNGKTIFIAQALPGETVNFQLTKKSGTFDEGQTVEILAAADDRVAPACPHYNLCGGCSLQHLKHNAQIAHKQQVLLDQLQHFGETQPKTVLPPVTGPAWAYRRKARLGVKYVIKKEKVLVGFRETNGRFLADIETCKILHVSIGERLTTLQALIASLDAFQTIPQIEIAIGDKQTACIFRHLEPLSQTDIEKICRFGEHCQIDCYLQPGGPRTIHKIYPEYSNLLLQYALPNHQITFQFAPTDFTQINADINRQMVDLALHLLDLQKTDTALDLFCGLGNFTLPIAKYCQQVTGIEGDENMTARAKANAEYNHLQNTEFFTANLFEPTLSNTWMKQPYNKILLDPPRAGAAEIIDQIDKFNAKKIVYISCNPATLARDAKKLVHDHHYCLQKAGIIDMFPHTSHVESIALFERD